jgi:hypothetical protein
LLKKWKFACFRQVKAEFNQAVTPNSPLIFTSAWRANSLEEKEKEASGGVEVIAGGWLAEQTKTRQTAIIGY